MAKAKSQQVETLLSTKESKGNSRFKIYLIVSILLIVFLNFYPPAKEFISDIAKKAEGLGWYGSIIAILFSGVLLIPLALPYNIVETTMAFTLQSFVQPFIIGATAKFVGCSICYFVSRKWFRNLIINNLKTNKLFKGISMMLDKEPWKFSFIFRVILLPYFVKNYGLAIPNAVSYFIYIIPATLIGSLITAMNVHLTQTVRNISGYNENVEKNPSSYELMFTLFAIGLMIYAGRYTYKVIKSIEQEDLKKNQIRNQTELIIKAIAKKFII